MQRDIQHRLRQQQPVGDHDHQFRREIAQRLLLLRRAQPLRLEHRQAQRLGAQRDRRGGQLLAAAGGTVRLGEHADDLVAGGLQGVQCGDGEVRRAGEDQPHQRAAALGLARRASFSSFFFRRSRFRLDR